MNAAVYGTIWIALALFAAGEVGRRGWRDGRPPASWGWPASAAGAAIAAVHIVLAMSTHDWSYETAALTTAQRTEAVYGLNWSGGVVVNYVFVGVWIADLAVWRAWRHAYLAAPRAVVWSLRFFYLVIVANAAIVFVAPSRRIFGAAVVGVLIYSWWPRKR